MDDERIETNTPTLILSFVFSLYQELNIKIRNFVRTRIPNVIKRERKKKIKERKEIRKFCT